MLYGNLRQTFGMSVFHFFHFLHGESDFAVNFSQEFILQKSL